MKKIIILAFVIVIAISVVACGGSYEDKLIGNWISSSGNLSVLYSFEKEGDAYKASCMTRNGVDDNFYVFDSFSASSSVITFRQDGKQTKEYYCFENGYLYIDNMEFEKID